MWVKLSVSQPLDVAVSPWKTPNTTHVTFTGAMIQHIWADGRWACGVSSLVLSVRSLLILFHLLFAEIIHITTHANLCPEFADTPPKKLLPQWTTLRNESSSLNTKCITFRFAPTHQQNSITILKLVQLIHNVLRYSCATCPGRWTLFSLTFSILFSTLL